MGLCKWLINLLKLSDFFGITFSFLINKDSQYRTTFGGFVSILISAIIAITFAFYLMELIQRTKFTLITQEILTSNPPPIFAISTNFTIMFTAGNSFGHKFHDDALFDFDLYQVTV